MRCLEASVACVIRQVDAADYGLTQFAFGQLDALKDSPDPWILSLGFRKPHLPYAVPEKHFRNIEEIYPALGDVPLPKHRVRDNPFSLANYYCHAIENYKEVQGTTVIGEQEPFSEQTTRTIRNGYYAAMAWADDLVGQVLQRLEDNSLDSSTIVVITSDHGWVLGEHGNWCKNSNYELAARTPLWIRDPLATTPPRKVEDMVSLVDLYPTILELAGLNQSMWPAHLEGISLAGLFRSEEFEYAQNNLTFTITARCFNIAADKSLSSKKCSTLDDISHLGYSIRTDRWRYTEWREYFAGNNSADWERAPLDAQLFDHEGDDGTDPDNSENTNLAVNASTFEQAVISALSGAIRKRFTCKQLPSPTACDLSNLEVPEEPTPTPTYTPSISNLTPSKSPVSPTELRNSTTPTLDPTTQPSRDTSSFDNSTITPTPSGGTAGLEGGEVAAIVVILLLLAGFGVAAVFYWRRLKEKEQGATEESDKSKAVLQKSENGASNEPESEEVAEKQQESTAESTTQSTNINKA